jgi:hypothetical protein
VISTSRPYRHGHGDDSSYRCVDHRLSRSSSSLSFFNINWPFCTDNILVDPSFHPWIRFCGCCPTGSGPHLHAHRRYLDEHGRPSGAVVANGTTLYYER